MMPADTEDPGIYPSWQPFVRGANSVYGVDGGGDGDMEGIIIILHKNIIQECPPSKAQMDIQPRQQKYTFSIYGFWHTASFLWDLSQLVRRNIIITL